MNVLIINRKVNAIKKTFSRNKFPKELGDKIELSVAWHYRVLSSGLDNGIYSRN